MIIELGKVHSDTEYRYLKAHYKLDCLRKVLICNFNNYTKFEKIIQENFKIYKPMKNIMCDLVNDIKINKDQDGNCYAQFRTKKYDQIARLLAYGNREVEGTDLINIILQRRK